MTGLEVAPMSMPAPDDSDGTPSPGTGGSRTEVGPQDVPPPHVPAAPPAPAVPGYETCVELARGGMGVVYRARDLTLKRDVAVKILRPGLAAHPGALRRFVTESRVTARLQHPGIPPVHALGRLRDGSPFLAMKLIQGRTLAELLDERILPAEDLPGFIGIFEKVCEAVAFAHSQGVIHRDLKPGNVMVGGFGEVQVMDWGLAKELGDLTGRDPDPVPTFESEFDAPRPDRTRTGSVLGTPGYMPPEQARGEWDRVDRRADVFALGAILCTILTGEPPLSGTTIPHVVARAAFGELGEALDRLARCGADAELVGVAKQCLRRDPADRPADAAAVLALVTAYRAAVEERLREAERERTEAAAREAEARRTDAERKAKEAAAAHEAERERRRNVTVGLVGALLAVAGLIVTGVWWTERQVSRTRAAMAAVDRRAAEVEQQAASFRFDPGPPGGFAPDAPPGAGPGPLPPRDPAEDARRQEFWRLCDLGVAAKERGDNGAAADYFRKAIQIDAASAFAWNELRHVLGSLDRPASLAAARELVRLDPSAYNYGCLGYAYHQMGDRKAAVEAYREAARLDPTPDRQNQLAQAIKSASDIDAPALAAPNPKP